MPGALPTVLWLVPAVPLAGFLLNGVLALVRPRATRTVSVIGVGVLVLAAGAAGAAVVAFARLHDPAPLVVRAWEWLSVGELHVDLALQLDPLSAVMILVVTGVGTLIHIFSVGYMHDDPGYARYFAYLNLFVFFMLLLVLGASFPVMFVGWEGVGLCSYLLIGFWFNEKINADAGKKAFIVNRIGDVGFLLAMLVIFQQTGSLDFTRVFAQAPGAFPAGGAAVTAAALLLFLGCAGKSAQIPLYTWLPDAMQGPTPVSALIHAATMVTAGVYLVARCNVLFALAPVASATVAGIGAVTALFAATIALKQWDIKRVLAYSTVSQLGYMFLGVGTGAYAGGIFHLATHACFKALLFLGAGSVIHAMHQAYHATHTHDDAQDMRNMGGLARHLPWTATLMWIATLALAGIPPLSGFFSKDEILGAAFAEATVRPVWYLFWALGMAAALLTAFYMTRLMLYTFHGPNRTGEREQALLREAPQIMTGPLVVLGALTVLAGALNLPRLLGGGALLERWLAPVLAVAQRLHPAIELPRAAQWALVAGAVAVAATGILTALRFLHPEALVPARLAPPETGLGRVLWKKWYVDELYDAVIVRPVMWLSRELLWKVIDVRLLDGLLVNGTAAVSRAIGWAGSRLETGEVGVYVVVFVLGVLAVLGAAVR
ncbi:MAG TPA: NADH-quinone oxidoreductase subunit L [Gemmatimonadales bacterium]|jgi:NADH-quinone oxidoreductase subunit L|nr:NADH-quinone oxidoreductase subunit L [Gemmatimonadales bacterium]